MRIINAPMFTVNGVSVNEYTVRALQIDIAKGIEPPVNVTDEDGNIRTIHPNGRLSGQLKGFDLSTKLLIQLVDPNDPNLLSN